MIDKGKYIFPVFHIKLYEVKNRKKSIVVYALGQHASIDYFHYNVFCFEIKDTARKTILASGIEMFQIFMNYYKFFHTEFP